MLITHPSLEALRNTQGEDPAATQAAVQAVGGESVPKLRRSVEV